MESFVPGDVALIRVAQKEVSQAAGSVIEEVWPRDARWRVQGHDAQRLLCVTSAKREAALTHASKRANGPGPSGVLNGREFNKVTRLEIGNHGRTARAAAHINLLGKLSGFYGYEATRRPGQGGADPARGEGWGEVGSATGEPLT